MRLKPSWLLFAALVVLFIIAAPLNSFLRIGGDFRSFVLPLGTVGRVAGSPCGAHKNEQVAEVPFYPHRCLRAGLAGQPVAARHFIKAFPTEPLTYILVFFVLQVTFIAGVVGTIITGIV